MMTVNIVHWPAGFRIFYYCSHPVIYLVSNTNYILKVRSIFKVRRVLNYPNYIPLFQYCSNMMVLNKSRSLKISCIFHIGALKYKLTDFSKREEIIFA